MATTAVSQRIRDAAREGSVLHGQHGEVFEPKRGSSFCSNDTGFTRVYRKADGGNDHVYVSTESVYYFHVPTQGCCAPPECECTRPIPDAAPFLRQWREL